MNKTFILATLALVAAIFALGSCDKTNGISIVPKFSSITCDPESPVAGDTMTFTAHQSLQGKLIYSATYKWAFRYFDDQLQRDTTVYRSENVVYDAIGGPDPQMGFRLPAYSTARQLYVNLNASYGLSGQTEQGQIFGQGSVSGTVNIR